MGAFKWLQKEVDEINWPTFHIVGGPVEISSEWSHLPTEYIDFVSEFGDVRLYRDLEMGFHTIGVYWPPAEIIVDDQKWLRIGHYDSTAAIYPCSFEVDQSVWELGLPWTEGHRIELYALADGMFCSCPKGIHEARVAKTRRRPRAIHR